MKELRIGFIGTGVISHRHMRVWNQLPGVKVVAGCDVNEKTLNAWGAKYNVENLYRDYKDLLARDDIDAVDVCVHNNLHVPISIAVMKAGKHCYCEKPMAGSYADAKLLYDAQKVYGKKLAVQISSIMTKQASMAREMIDEGKLGNIYHMRSVGYRRFGRPGLDYKMLSPDFYSGFYAGHGALFDMGVYHISMLLFAAGIPELESVYGTAYTGVDIDERLLEGRTFDVEDLGVGLAKYKGGLTLDIIESWALNVDAIGNTFIAGNKGGLRFTGIDSYGGPLAIDPGSPYKPDPATLSFYGYDEKGNLVDTDLHLMESQMIEENLNPAAALYYDNHKHWVAYLNGELTDETRYNTPWLALQTMLVSEGIFLSKKLGRSVTKDEIEAMSESTSVRRQETDWGILEYDF